MTQLENQKVKELKQKNLQMPKNLSIKDLRAAVTKIINRLKIFKYSLDSNSIRLWKLDPEMKDLVRFKEHLMISVMSSKSYDYQISYNGDLLDRDPAKLVEEIGVLGREPIVVEINEPGKMWIFFNELVKACKKCEYCNKIDFTEYCCSCQKVFSFLLFFLFRCFIVPKTVNTVIGNPIQNIAS